MTRLFNPASSPYREEVCCRGGSTAFPVEIYNRPGLPAIRYRCGTHSQFKHFMLSRLSAKNRAALHALTTRADEDFSIALLDAMAVMSDVLAFYQERIVQESYLRTAAERFSITQMARAVGYKPMPGLAAKTYLVFTLDSSPGSPQTVEIPEGTQAQSIPKEQGKFPQDKLPQTFETTELLTARVEWNELRPRMTKLQKVRLSAGAVFLQHANLNLQTGDVLLFINKNDKAAWNIVRITKAEPQPQFDRTKVSWFWPEEDDEGFLVSEEADAKNVDVYVFRERANIFGYNAPDWGALPDIAKATYLGITDPTELTAEEFYEWPQYFLQAPIFPYEYSAQAEPCRDVYPTPESVAAAVNAVAKASTDALQGMALSSIPNAAIQVIQAIATTLNEILAVAKEFQKIIENTTNENGTVISDLASKLRDLLTCLVPFGGIDFQVWIGSNNDILYMKWDPDEGNYKPAKVLDNLGDFYGIFSALINTLQKIKDKFDQSVNAGAAVNCLPIAETLASLVQSLPILAPYQAVVKILDPGNQDNPLIKIGVAINNAATAVTNVPESLAKAVGGHIVAKVVTLAVQAIMEMPIFTDDENFKLLENLTDIDISQLKDKRLSLTPELVAITAYGAAKITVAMLRKILMTDAIQFLKLLEETNTLTDPQKFLRKIFDLNHLAELKDVLFTKSWANVKDDKMVDDDEKFFKSGDEVVNVLPNLLAAGATAHLAASAVLVAFIWPTIIPAIIPLAIGYVLFAEILGDDVFTGAKETQKWICKVAKAALQPRKEDLSPRKELKRLSIDQIDLDKVYSKITPSSLMLLSLPQTKALYSVKEVTEASRSDFTLNAQVTRLTLEDAEKSEPANFGPIEVGKGPENPFRRCVRMTSVFANSEKLKFSKEPDTDPISVGNAGARIPLDRLLIPELAVNRRLIITGLQHEGSVPLVDVLTLSEQNKSKSGEFSELVFHERDGDIHEYLRESVKIFANVAAATHGATVEEVLGSGEAAQASQTFKLRQPHVTYVASSSETGSTSTLEVRVNDVLWEEVPYLYNIGPRLRAYSTEIEDSGEMIVRFGDGLNGARPHTGLENIRARYRSGIGSIGNVGAGDISLLTKRPQGVVNVTNPLEAGSGSDPEPPSNIRSNIPSTTLLLERIVSLRDYEDFAAAFPDVCKARAVQQGYGPDRKIHVTVAGSDGAPIGEDRRKDLLNAMRMKGDPHVSILLQNYKMVQFVLAAQITCEKDYLVEKVADAVCVALENHFSFDSRQLGQPVTLMEIMALIQGSAGVTAIDVDQLYRMNQTVQTAPPTSPINLGIVNEDNFSTSSSTAGVIDGAARKISFICKYSEKDYSDIVSKDPNILEKNLRISPQELLLPKEITLLFIREGELK